MLPRGRGMAVRHTSIGHDCVSIVPRHVHGRGDQQRVSFEALFLVEKQFRLSVAFAPSSLERCCGASACRVSNDIANRNSSGDEIEREERDHDNRIQFKIEVTLELVLGSSYSYGKPNIVTEFWRALESAGDAAPCLDARTRPRTPDRTHMRTLTLHCHTHVCMKKEGNRINRRRHRIQLFLCYGSLHYDI